MTLVLAAHLGESRLPFLSWIQQTLAKGELDKQLRSITFMTELLYICQYMLTN